MGLDSPHGHHPEKGLNLHGEDLAALVRLLQAHTPLERLSNMEARTVFEFMAHRGYRVVAQKEHAAPAEMIAGAALVVPGSDTEIPAGNN
jgi:hypothetical protein